VPVYRSGGLSSMEVGRSDGDGFGGKNGDFGSEVRYADPSVPV